MTTQPDISKDGVFFTEYKEGVPGVQTGTCEVPTCMTFNPDMIQLLPLCMIRGLCILRYA